MPSVSSYPSSYSNQYTWQDISVGFVGLTTGGCSGKQVGTFLRGAVLVSLPLGDSAADIHDLAVSVPAVTLLMGQFGDGPLAFAQWLLLDRAPTWAMALESYRWVPQELVTGSRSWPNHEADPDDDSEDDES